MRYCTRKILKAKYNKHKELTFCPLRNYPFNVYKQVLERASFPKYDNFHNTDIAYNDRLDCVVNAVAPFKTVRVKTTQAGGLMEKLQIRHIPVISYTKDLSYMLMEKSIRKHET